MNKRAMKCPSCGAAELVRDTRDLPYTYKGYATAISAVTGHYCTSCGQILLRGEDGNHYVRAIKDFNGFVDGPQSANSLPN